MRRRQAANGQSAADEHSPQTIPVALRPRNVIKVVSETAQYGLPPGESKNKVHSPPAGTLNSRSVSSLSLSVKSPTKAISIGSSSSGFDRCLDAQWT